MFCSLFLKLYCPFQDTDLAWHTETPDLTPCFRKTVLTWFPALFLWLCAVFDLRASSNNPNAASPIPWNPLNVAKMGFAVLLAGVDLTFLLLARGAEPSFNADIYGPAIKIATYVGQVKGKVFQFLNGFFIGCFFFGRSCSSRCSYTRRDAASSRPGSNPCGHFYSSWRKECISDRCS